MSEKELFMQMREIIGAVIRDYPMYQEKSIAVSEAVKGIVSVLSDDKVTSPEEIYHAVKAMRREVGSFNVMAECEDFYIAIDDNHGHVATCKFETKIEGEYELVLRRKV